MSSSSPDVSLLSDPLLLNEVSQPFAMSDRDQSPNAGGNAEEQPKSEHLNIKVTDNNNEVFFKIKRTTALSKLMNAFCERQGKSPQSVRFLFDGSRVNPTDTPDGVSLNDEERNHTQRLTGLM